MSVDYLDLLLMRETRTAPLAEPRIDPAPSAAVLATPGWGESSEEREVAYVPPPAAGPRRTGVEAGPVEARSRASIDAAVFPLSTDRPGERPLVSERLPLPPPTPARIVAADGAQEPTAPRPVQTRDPIDEAVATAAMITAADAGAAPAGPRPPRPQPRPQEAPRVIATRPAPVAPRLGAAPAVAQPVTIRIDRVEVRAAPAATPPAPASPRPRPSVTLDEYLKRRSGARHE